MAWCARCLVLALLLPLQAVAQRSDSTVIPEGLESRVISAVAAMWSVSEEQLEVEWGTIVGEDAALSTDAEFRLLPGTRGAFVVEFRKADGSPLAVRLRAGVLDTVVVAARPLAVGATLQEQDLSFAQRSRWGPPGESSAPVPEAGWVVRRAVASGDILEEPTVQRPLLVRPGSRVTLVWQRNSVRVSVVGSAINGGALGDEVRVRLDDRHGRVRGVVTGEGVARLTSGGKR